MKYTHILVPYDKSESARNALSAALDLAKDYPETKVTVFTAVNMPDYNDASYMAAAKMAGVPEINPDDLIKMQRSYLANELGEVKEDLADIIEGAPNKVVVKLGAGKPSQAIVEFAEEHEADLIVMGCRGLNAVRGMLGSVSYAVLRGAKCPVMVVK